MPDFRFPTVKKIVVDFLNFNFPSPYHSINFSLRRLMLIKLGILLNFVKGKLLTELSSRRKFSGTKKTKGSYAGSTAIVVANGPSAINIDWEEVGRAREKKLCFLFLVNYSLNDPSVRSRGVDFLVLSDPASHPSSQDARTVELWKNIRMIPNLRLITPVSWHLKMEDKFCDSGNCFHFSDLSLETIRNSTSPLKARGYPSLTAYKALAFADYLGFDQIFIIGIDNSMFRTLKVDSMNSLVQNSNHFTENYGPPTDVTEIYPNGIADYFSELSEMFLSLKRSFTNMQVINLGYDSEVDAFPKVQKGETGSNYVKNSNWRESI